MEFLKIRRFCILLPALAAIFLLFMTGGLWFLNYRGGPGGLFSAFSVMYFFLTLTLMLSTTILASIIAFNEHETKTWSLVCTLPISKIKIYISKFSIVSLLILFEVVLIVAGTSIIWMFIANEPIPWDIVIKQPLYCFFASIAFISIQTWLSTFFQNQSIPIGFGVLGSISSLFLARSDFSYFHYLPWSYPALSTPLIADHLQWVIMGITTGVVLLIIGSLHFNKLEW